MLEGPVNGGGPSRGKLIPKSQRNFLLHHTDTPGKGGLGEGQEEAASEPDVWSQRPPP